MRTKISRILTLMLFLVFLSFSVFAFNIENIMKAPFTSGLISCQCKDRVAWVFKTEGVRNIWIADGPEWRPRPVTFYKRDDGQEISQLAFSPDGSIIVYVRGGGPNRQGEYPNPTSDPAGAREEIWAVKIDDGQPWLIGEGSSPAVSPTGEMVAFLRQGIIYWAPLEVNAKSQRLFFSRGRVRSFAFSPDGTKIAFESFRDDHSFIGVYYLRDQKVKWISPSVDMDSYPVWSGDGKYLAFFRYPARKADQVSRGSGRNFSIMVAEPERDECWTVWNCPDDSGGFAQTYPRKPLTWAGDRIIFYSEHDGWMHLYSVYFREKSGKAVCLTEGNFEAEDMTVSPDGKSVIFNSNKDDIDRRHIWSVPAGGGQPKSLTSGKGIEWSPVVSASGKYLVFISSTAFLPGTPAVLDLNTGKSWLIARELIPKDFPAEELVEPQQVVFKAPDGLEIHGQLFLPKNIRSGEKLPAVIFLHGGPIRQMLLGWHYSPYYHNAYAFNQFLASRGYVVLSVNFRSGIGYGRAFRTAPNQGPRGASEYQDVVAGAKYLQKRPEVDSERIGLWGGSYGGYLTALALARDSELFAAGVDLHGVHDWSLRARRRDGGGWDITPDEYRIAFDSSPVADVQFWTSPVLFIHGDDDRNVDFIQTVDLVARLRELKKAPVEIMVIPDEVHSFLLHENWVKVFKKSVDFFDRYLKLKK